MDQNEVLVYIARFPLAGWGELLEEQNGDDFFFTPSKCQRLCLYYRKMINWQ
jgi:hypothetical protein